MPNNLKLPAHHTYVISADLADQGDEQFAVVVAVENLLRVEAEALLVHIEQAVVGAARELLTNGGKIAHRVEPQRTMN